MLFFGVSTDKFHRISHVKTTKEAWTILKTTYERTKKVKDTNKNAHYLICGSEDELFDSFYGRLNEIGIATLNLQEKIEDAKVVRKVLRSFRKLPS